MVGLVLDDILKHVQPHLNHLKIMFVDLKAYNPSARSTRLYEARKLIQESLAGVSSPASKLPCCKITLFTTVAMGQAVICDSQTAP